MRERGHGRIPTCLRERAGVGGKVGRVAIEVGGRARLGAERVSRGLGLHGLLVRRQNGTEDPRMDRKRVMATLLAGK